MVTVAAGEDDAALSNTTKRLRWATQRVHKSKSDHKRMSILDRLHKSPAHKKRDSAGTDSVATDLSNHDGSTDASDDGSTGTDTSRKINFNIPLAADLLDENGHPLVRYPRNKIRTAKYTPLSFVPKNLFFQFQNIANVYFLFLIILAVSLSTSGHVRDSLPLY